MAGIFSALIVIAVLILAIFSIHSVQSSSLEAAMIMGRKKLTGDMAYLEDKISQEYGQIGFKDGNLVDARGNSLKNDYRIVDLISSRLGVQATIFMKEGQDYRRITTSIVDGNGKRAVDTFLGSASAAYNPIQSGKDYFGKAIILGKDYLTVYRPLFAQTGSATSHDVIGILFAGIEMSSIDEYIVNSRNSVITLIVIIGLIIIVLSILAVVVSSRIMLLKPIRSILHVIGYLSDGDFTVKLNVTNNDEIGEIANNLNIAIDKIRTLLITITHQAVALADTGDNLSKNMNGTTAAVNEITSNIQGIKDRVINQGASVSETHATMEQLTMNINKLGGQVESQSNDISQVSSAIEQMVANTRSVTDTLIKNSGNVEELREAAEVGRAGLQGVATDIKEIASESEGLLEINTVMKGIANQTNLLSMNAAIEAAHAGEAGLGFAVVAGEIRKLAENSGEQSKMIGTVLKKIKESIDKITHSTENVLNKFEAIGSCVKTVSDQEENIRSAMEEQGDGSKQILAGVGSMNEITRQVKNGSHEMLGGAKEVIQESTNLEKVTQEITSRMNEMVSDTDQINAAVNRVSDISGKTREGIATLINEVSRFKVE